MDGADEGMACPPLLYEILADAREAGFLGPGDIEPQIRHARGFAAIGRRLAAPGPPTPRLVDLGSGGGLPGLVVAVSWPEATVDLLEAGARRAAFLEQATSRLGLGARVRVLHERAEVCGRQAGFRGGYDGALARSFGRPAVVAECAAPLLEVGGWLVVSEPPHGGEPADADGGPRWPAEPLARLGLEPGETVSEEFEYRILRQVAACPERFPRRNGVPAKKPLF
ncbi:MAG: RsmG family class I SAM-dependent methyltransferase [Acidimicrobiales bacterium]|jgi:16S rRNA (guanine527-N7)-methyltransferase